jgi:tRNA pseudouridine32 synthase/23S rRNA pseudouridine746 synthase
MSISKHSSTVFLPSVRKPYPTILEFLSSRFPHISKDTWSKRILENKVLDEDNIPINLNTEFTPRKKLYYFREVEHEIIIPFKETIIFKNTDFLIADKPHFLPVIPTGGHVNECLINRLRPATGIKELAAVHRLDKDTAGLLLFSCSKRTRALYTNLFKNSQIEKTYQAVASIPAKTSTSTWVVKNRITDDDNWIRSKIVQGRVNAISNIKLVKRSGKKGIFELKPVTGKKHQLRVHMSSLGFNIINDNLYPLQIKKEAADFTKPLQLVAKYLKFIDPVSKKMFEFVSGYDLEL